MFRRTYDIRKEGRFVHLNSKAVDFEKNISLRLVGLSHHMSETTQILGLEYQGKIFPFDVGQLTETDVEYKTVKACEVFLTARPESYYFKDNKNPFFVDKEKLVFDYETIDQYEKVCNLLHEALNVMACHYGSAATSPREPRYFYKVRCSDIPHNMQPKSTTTRIVTGKELLFGSTKNPKDMGYASLKILLDGMEMEWGSKSKAIQDMKKNNQKLIEEFGGIDRVKNAKKEKEERALKLLTVYVDEYMHPKNPKEIIDFFESKNSLTAEQIMAELIELVAIGADQHHYGAIINLGSINCLTTPPVLKLLKSCYKKELSDIFDNFESFLLKLVLQLESECHVSNNIRIKTNQEDKEREMRKRYEQGRAEHNKKNRYKFWKKLR